MRKTARHLFIDLGAFNGDTVELALKHLPKFDEVYCFEPLAIHCDTMRERFAGRGYHIINAAADVTDGSTRIFMGGEYGDIASSIHEGNPNCTSDSVVVRTIDFPRFLRELVAADPNPARITLKLNIEGSEYAILEQMLVDGSISLISTIYCDWHWQFMNLREEDHHTLVTRLRRAGHSLCGDKPDELYNACRANTLALKFQKSRSFYTRRVRLFLKNRVPVVFRVLKHIRQGLRSVVSGK
jgi:FkbM family methyltransferase